VKIHIENLGFFILLLSLGSLNGLSSILVLNLKVKVLSYRSFSSLSVISLVVLLVIIIESVSGVPERLINLPVFESSYRFSSSSFNPIKFTLDVSFRMLRVF